MRMIERMFVLMTVCGLFTSCEMVDFEPNEMNRNQSHTQNIQNLEKTPAKAFRMGDREPIEIVASQVTARSGFAPIGSFSYGKGGVPGSNVSLFFDGTNINFYVIGYDGSMAYFRSDPYTLRVMQSSPDDTVGIEINLDSYSSTKWITIDTVEAAPFAYSSANVLLSGDFDAKISKPDGIPGSPITGTSPAFIGGDDARDGNIHTGNGSYGKLDFGDDGVKIRIHHLQSGGSHYLVISSNTYTVPAETNYCFWNFRQQYWGISFQYSHTTCK